MRHCFVVGFAVLGTVGCGGSGPGPDLFTEFDQSPPLNGVQPPPSGGTLYGTSSQSPPRDAQQQAPYNAQEPPPPEESVPGTGGVVVDGGGGLGAVCEELCSAFAGCQEAGGARCVPECVAGLREDECVGPISAYYLCVARSPSFTCALLSSDAVNQVPQECSQQFLAFVTCVDASSPPEPATPVDAQPAAPVEAAQPG
jgi:hypothetical protein